MFKGFLYYQSRIVGYVCTMNYAEAINQLEQKAQDKPADITADIWREDNWQWKPYHELEIVRDTQGVRLYPLI